MNNFTFIQKLRNKIKIKNKTVLNISKTSKIVGCNIYIKGQNNSISIGENSIIRNTNIEIIGNDCHLKIGKECMVGDNCYLAIKESTTLSIGDDCGLSRNVKIMTSDGHPIFKDDTRINEAKNVTLGTHIWVADNVTILKGVEIEDGCVIGINATITKNVPKNSIAAGNPAIVVKENIEWKS